MNVVYDLPSEVSNENSTGWFDEPPTEADEMDYASWEAEVALRKFPDRGSRAAFLLELEERIATGERLAETSEAPW